MLVKTLPFRNYCYGGKNRIHSRFYFTPGLLVTGWTDHEARDHRDPESHRTYRIATSPCRNNTRTSRTTSTTKPCNSSNNSTSSSSNYSRHSSRPPQVRHVPDLFTVRNEVAKVMFLHLSVSPRGGGLPQCVLGYHPPGAGTHTPRSRPSLGSRHTPLEQAPPPRACTLRSRHPSQQTAIVADGTHPTGMHSCVRVHLHQASASTLQ